MKVWVIVGMLVLLGAGCAVAQEQGLEKLLNARGMRASSSDPDWQNGNADARPIPPGGTLTLAELQGPGMIRHIWFTVAASDSLFPRKMVLRMYWNGEKDPSVETPLGDFFAVGHGLLRTVNSIPVHVSSDGRGYNCYWRMPFSKSAKITMTNDSSEPVQALYYYIDWTSEKSIPKDSGYFHARYRQEYPCTPGEDYVICEAKGRGLYIGTVQSVVMAEASWYGEGDDRFYIDGEKEPSLKGTGTEDYFCDGWGFRLFNGPYYGVTVLDGYNAGDRCTVYRWHIPDPIPFKKSLKMTIEHKGGRCTPEGKQYTGYEERPDYFSTVAFWYQKEPHQPFGEVPKVEERFLPVTAIEGEDMIATGTFTPDTKTVQPLANCSGGNQLFFTPKTTEASFELKFDVPKTLEGIVELSLVHSFDYGIYTITLDATHTLSNLNLYNPSIMVKGHGLPIKELTAGPHTLKFRCVGTDPKSAGSLCGFDAIQVRNLKP